MRWHRGVSCFVQLASHCRYGIQARSGCSCAGPYGHRLLDVDDAVSATMHDDIVGAQVHGIKPGWTRVSVDYLMSDEEVDFLADAITQVGCCLHANAI